MTPGLALVLTLLVMVGVNVWVHVGPERWQPVTGPAVAVLLLAIGRSAGLSWADLGLGRAAVLPGLLWGGAAVALVAAVYGVGVSLPAPRRWFLDARNRVGPGRAARRALLVVPLAVVVLEEVAFRSVLWGLVEVGRGPLVAVVGTSVLFGLWHVLPAIDGARANAADGDSDDARRAVVIRQVAGTVAFTALAGIVFAVLRQQSGSLVAPFLLHWATNGLGILAAAWAWRTQRD